MLSKIPNFLIGGTSAGGTSFLSAILIQHPEIFLPKKMRPEPHFSTNVEYKNGKEYYLKKWFSNVPKNAKAVGERSSSYMFGGENVAKKIKEFNPNMKFMFTLRNPIERAWANYRYTVLQGLEENTFSYALENEEERVDSQKGIWSEIQPYNYTGRGFYFNQLNAFIENFPRENILLIKSKLLSIQTSKEINKILDFLDVNNKNFSYSNVPDHTSCNVLEPYLQVELRDYFNERFDTLIEAIRKNKEIDCYAKNDTDRRNIEKLKQNMLGQKKICLSPQENIYKNYMTMIFKNLNHSRF